MLDRLDNFDRAQSALGDGVNQAIKFYVRSSLTRKQRVGLYVQDEIAARAIDKMVDDAFRHGYDLENVVDHDGNKVDPAPIMERIRKLQINEQIADADKRSRLHGGALLYVPTDRQYDQSITAAPRYISTPTVFDADEAVPLTQDGQIGSRTYGKILKWQVSPMAGGTAFEMHHHHVIPFEPIPLPLQDTIQLGRNGWGPSILERLWTPLSRYGAAQHHSVRLMYTASLLYVKMKGFAERHQADGGREQIRTFLSDLRQSLDARGVVGLDAADELGAIVRGASDVHNLSDRLRDYLAAYSPGMPKEILLNESPAGLNAGELSGPQALWFATVTAHQEGKLTAVLDEVLATLIAAEFPHVASWEIAWAPLWIRSEEAQAKIYSQLAAADTAYAGVGLVPPDAVTQHRFVAGKLTPVRMSPEKPAASLDLSEPDETDVAGQVEAEAPDVAATAMNGAQITSLVSIVQSVAEGTLPRDSGIAIIQASFPSQAARAEQIMGSAGVPREDDEDEATPGLPRPDKPLMSAAEAGAMFGASAASLATMRKAGTISAWQVNGRWKYDPDEIAAAVHRPAQGPNAEDQNPGEADPADA